MKSALLEQHTATDKKIATVELDTIQTRGLQTRETTDRAKVAEYAEIYRTGGTMPPIVVFSDGGDEFYLADGHHRVAAARQAEVTEIEAIIKKGDRRAALWYATAANAQHGLPRTNEDKRRAVALILADEEWRQLSDTQIAEHAQVSDRLVAKVRKETGTTTTSVKGKDGKVRRKPAAKPKAKDDGKPHTAIQRELMGDGIDADEDSECPDQPPGIYLDADQHSDSHHVLISSDAQAESVLIPGAKIRSSYGGSAAAVITAVQPYRAHGCLVYGITLKDGGNINELVTWNGEIRKLYACNTDRFTVGTGPKPKAGKDDSAELAKMGFILGRQRQTAPADQQAPTITAHSPAAGPEEITAPDDPTPSPQIPAAPPKAQPPAPSAKADKAGRPLALRRLDAQRDLIAHELRQGKPRWTGTDNDLWLLGLICGVPTRAQAWIDAARAQARDLFIDALRFEIADRVHSGEAANTPKWPSLRELCALWGLDYAALEIRAERAVPE